MPGIIQLQRQRSPWEQMLPSFMQNIMFQNMAQKRALAQQEAQQKRREEEEIRGYKAKGWREPDKQKPIITVGDTGLVPPEKGYEVKTVKGRQVLVESMTPYGGKPQVQKASAMATTKEGKLWMHHPKLRRKRQVLPSEVPGLMKAGWVQGQPYGSQSQTQLTVGPDGSVQFVQGGAVPGGVGELTRGAKGEFQKEVSELSTQMQQLEASIGGFNPEYHRWGTQALMEVTKIQEKLQGVPGIPPPSQTEKEKLAAYTTYKANTREYFAKSLHELAKGTLTRHESKKYGGFLANADKMSETEFMSTAKANYRSLKKQIARKHYYLNVDQSGTPQQRLKNFHKMRKENSLMSVAEFDRMIDTEYAKKLNELRTQNPDTPYEQLKQKALDLVEATFYGF